MLTTRDPATAARALAEGHLAAVPTETVYGLGARADRPQAIARVYAAKGRPANHPLIVHLLEATSIHAWGEHIPAYALALAATHWPGPLTLVVHRTARAGDHITGGQDTVAIRVPAHPVMRAVLEELAELTGDEHIGIAAPSANRFGRVSPTTAAHVVAELEDELDDDDVILDGGASDVGVESTIVDCTGSRPVLLRPGHVSAADIKETTGLDLAERTTVRAPGMLASHYSPRATVTLVNTDTSDGRATGATSSHEVTTGFLAEAQHPTPHGYVRLSAPGDADEYAQVLYAALREADSLGLTEIVAIPPDEAGIGAAVIDRLQRAAAGN